MSQPPDPSRDAFVGARILIVDDDEANTDLLERTLERAGYAHVRSTNDPRQALSIFEEIQPDLLLLDLHMPHLDGFGVIGALYEQVPAAAAVPILVLTADATSEAKQRALEMGARDFLTKPIDLPEVLARVENLLEIRFLRIRLETQELALRELRELSREHEGDAPGGDRPG